MRNMFRQLARKWSYSFIGLWTAFKEEKSLWAYLLLMPILIGVGTWVDLSIVEWTVVILVMFMVVAIEVINTAVEATVDAISFQYNIKVKKIKDIASGATLVMTTGMIITILMIYIPKLMEVL